MRDLAALPKAHLHVHLESTIRPSTLAELGFASDTTEFDGFRSFADHNSLVRQCLTRPEHFTRIAAEFCEDQAAQGVRYGEVTFTAAAHGERLGDPDMPLAAVLDGLAPEFTVILDHSRRRSPERFAKTLELARNHDRVVAIGMAGEERHSMQPFAELLDAARDAGVRLVHHAGEDAGPDSIAEALDLGHAARIGHGIRCLESPDLVARLLDQGVPLEVCPSSNVGLGLVPSWPEHPLPRLVEAGLRVTVNTDVPASVGTDLVTEYERIRKVFGYDDAALACLARAGVDASFAPDAVKAALHAGIGNWLDGGE
ncbi:adenosine deaminase family protein [Kutzneria sp. CA-103260]|uniref:adenosine deaminase family protein n=1 Tax=Kutzneria sp. CA-103260 TaxID=2802641 RepID=UPI001BAB314F|nr:adenosine deaminase family protein [Kutzneria sp. CA-103260]QUQ68230.1 adenosine deaminase [Kutzneria sp. CA-103260]